MSDTPLERMDFPVWCEVCGGGPFNTGDEVDEHISEDHISEAVWDFAYDNLKPRHEPPSGEQP